MDNKFIDRQLNELDSLVSSAFQFYEDKDYDSAICYLEDLISVAGNLVPEFEALEEGKGE